MFIRSVDHLLNFRGRLRKMESGLGRLRLLAVLICGAAIGLMQASVYAKDFPTSVRSKSATAMKKVVEDAAANSMIPSDIQVKITRLGPRFDCQFQPNGSKTPWLIIMNAPKATMIKRDNEYSEQGYFRAIERQVMFQGTAYFTIVWHKKPEQKVPLKLPAGPIPTSGFDNAALKPLDDFATAFVKQHNAAGMTIAVAKDGRMVYSKGFGYSDVPDQKPMQPDALMRIASISKPLTAVTLLKMVEGRKLSLDEPIMPLLESKRYRLAGSGDQRWNQVTVRQLLQHAGGWDRDISPDPMFQVVEITLAKKLRRPAGKTDILRYQLTQPLDFDPGERYAYSNFGYSVVGRAMEVVGDAQYEALVKRLVLDPCGMTKTKLGRTRLKDQAEEEVRYHMQTAAFHTPFWATPAKARAGTKPVIHPSVEEPYGRWDLEVMDAHGGWISTAPDLLRFVVALDATDKPLLAESSRKLLVQRPEFSDDEPVWYGMGWQVRQKRSSAEGSLNKHNIWHTGALAGTSTILVRRNDGFAWAILFNTDRSTNGERLASLVDSQMHKAVAKVDVWPDYDLFDPTK